MTRSSASHFKFFHLLPIIQHLPVVFPVFGKGNIQKFLYLPIFLS